MRLAHHGNPLVVGFVSVIIKRNSFVNYHQQLINERCVRDVLAKQALRVRRYSVKGTTSSSRRGRSRGFVLVRIDYSPFEDGNMVHYLVPEANGGTVKFLEVA